VKEKKAVTAEPAIRVDNRDEIGRGGWIVIALLRPEDGVAHCA
jgi:hypothetical protein